jgi:class 3 adenylate cyclase
MRQATETDLVATLKSYVPGLIVRRLAADPRPIAEPIAERASAAILFADMTGFTALAERLAERGIAGTEDLARLLNDYFSRVIEIVQAHGGEVTKFAGDGLLTLWPIRSDIARLGRAAEIALGEAVIRAAQCGLALQAQLHNFVVDQGISLSLGIGIGAGDVYVVHLGGVFGRWEFLLSGSPLVQMSVAKENAGPGKVVLSPQAWQLAQERCLGLVAGDRFVELKAVTSPLPAEPLKLPNLPQAAAAGLKAYIPAAVVSRLEVGHGDWLSEMRRISVLFVKLPNYGTSITHPYARTLPEAQSVMLALQTSLYRYAGSINKFNVDDKGITLVAALGLPPLSQKDDASRAVHAALDMVEAVQGLGRQVAIGVATGWVFCGPVGHESRREYTVVGNEVNMAARLMQVAESRMDVRYRPAAIIVDEETYHAVRLEVERGQSLASQLKFDRMAPVSVKGRVEPVAAFRPWKSERPSVYRHSPASHGHNNRIVGRWPERALLAEFLMPLLEGQKELGARVVIIEGEAGVGKSLVVEDLVSRAESGSLGVLAGGGGILEQSRAFHAWSSIFQQLYDVRLPLVDIDSQRSRVMSRLPMMPGERGYPALALRLSPLLNTVLPLGFPENKLTGGMPPAIRRRTTRLFLVRLLQLAFDSSKMARRAPRLIVLDNGQWMDEASWELALSASRQVRPLLMVIVTRPIDERTFGGSLPRACQRLLTSRTTVRLKLGALDINESNQLLCQELKVSDLPEAAVGILQRRTGGNPLYLEEVARDWHRSGLLTIKGSSCLINVDPQFLEEYQAPDIVQKVVMGRIDQLSPAQQLILKVGSVIGPSFSLETIASVYPVNQDRQEIAAHLQALERLGLLRRESEPDETTYTFTYGIIHEMAARLLLSAQQQQLQSLIANA